ncbi:MAG: peptidase T [Mogibacterium sp.]|nr:peptidase T [Mogibacterium sp.]
MSSAVDRFMRYIAIDTQSDPDSGSTPSTSKQFRLAKLLAEEMTAMGVSDVRYDEEHCYVYGEIPANCDGDIPAVAFIAHIDTAPDAPGDASNAGIVTDYDGGVIALNGSVSLDPKAYPELRNYEGCDLIVTDGVSLLGADDKAGIAEIMTMAERLINDPSIPHGRVGMAFTSDEEICGNARFFDIEGFGMDYAYTVDGGPVGEIEYENFNAAEAIIRVSGRNIHPGDAKDVMVNAVRIAAELDVLLPQAERPEHTEGYDGFFHLTSLSGGVTEAESRYIIRDHDDEKFQIKLDLMQKSVDFLNLKYNGAVGLELTEQYRNMRKLIEPHMFLVENAKKAFADCGVEPVVLPIRGGTDGAMLTYRGLPCPNLSTGGHNFHSNTEYIPVQSLEKMADVLVELASLPAI